MHDVEQLVVEKLYQTLLVPFQVPIKVPLSIAMESTGAVIPVPVVLVIIQYLPGGALTVSSL